MKIYIRKLKEHDITHEVSVKTNIVNEFFDGKDSFTMIGKKSSKNFVVKIHSATDPRFGGSFKNLLREEGDVSVGDIIVIYKYQKHFVLEIIPKSDSKFEAIKEICKRDERHTILLAENEDFEEVIDDIQERDYFIVSANNYDNYHKKFFDRYNYLYWEQSDSKSYKIGDVVYIYCSYPIKRIKVKTIITDINITNDVLIEDKYYENVGFENNFYSEKYISLKLIKEIDDEGLSLESLQNKGFNNILALIHGFQITDKTLVDYIESYFVDDFFDSDNMELSELVLGKILKMYYNSSECTKNAGIMLFGITYGDYIINKNKKIAKIIKFAEIEDSYKHELHKALGLKDFVVPRSLIKTNKVELPDDVRVKGGINRIYYGIPGCGKSYIADKFAKSKTDNENLIVRTTFYPDYTNSDFLGQIIPKIDNDNKNSILYDIQSGPFTEALVKAIDNPDKNVCLIVEEINRGNAAAIFGDVFQLLDRDIDGTSEYWIKNYIITAYLKKKCINSNYDYEHIRIPSNLILIGTMNTSDQNVFTLDTAFKRRWSTEYIINDVDNSVFKDKLIPILGVKWKNFVKEINKIITEDDDTLGINGEDKQLGSYFISAYEWSQMDKLINENNEIAAAKIFAEKVLSYIWEDVAKIDKTVIFKDNYKTFDKVLIDFINAKEVFNFQLDKE